MAALPVCDNFRQNSAPHWSRERTSGLGLVLDDGFVPVSLSLSRPSVRARSQVPNFRLSTLSWKPQFRSRAVARPGHTLASVSRPQSPSRSRKFRPGRRHWLLTLKTAAYVRGDLAGGRRTDGPDRLLDADAFDGQRARCRRGRRHLPRSRVLHARADRQPRKFTSIYILPVTSPNVHQFLEFFFTSRLNDKCAAKQLITSKMLVYTTL